MSHSHLPASTATLRVDVRGAEIVNETESRETSNIYLPQHTEYISHVALDIGGSLAKVVYFTRAAHSSSHLSSSLPTVSCAPSHPPSSLPNPISHSPHHDLDTLPRSALRSSTSQPSGYLTPAVVRQQALSDPQGSSHHRTQSSLPPPSQHPENTKDRSWHACEQERRSGVAPKLVRSPSMSAIPGGRLNFTKFETESIESECIPFLINLIEVSAKSNGVPISTMKKAVKIILTGGGAYKYFEQIKLSLGGDVDVLREEEMECLITGLNFLTEIPNEVFWFSDELVQEIVNNNPRNAQEQERMADTSSKTTTAINSSSSDPIVLEHNPGAPPPVPLGRLPSPSPNPPRYSVLFDTQATPQFPCMLVNIGSGVSIIKVSDFGKFERVSGTSLGGGTLWGLLSLLTDAKSFDEMLDISMKGDNSSVDMLVGDIYGQDYEKIGLKSSVIASSFGKVFRNKSGGSGLAASATAGEAGITTTAAAVQSSSKSRFSQQDISKSLLYAISNNIGQIAHLNAEKHGLDRIYFGGCFIRGHVATVSTLSYAIRFWSKGTKRAYFLRHEGYLGSVGAWLNNLSGT